MSSHQTPGEFQREEAGYGIYLSGDGVYTIVDAATNKIAFRAKSFEFDQLVRICQILARVVTEARLQAELDTINRVRRALLLDDLTEV